MPRGNEHIDEAHCPGSATADNPHRLGSIYEIRVRGELAADWSTCFDGLLVANEDRGETVIVGPVPDQAALHGLLARVRDLGLPLLSLRMVENRDR
jgi:hypothetical protein